MLVNIAYWTEQAFAVYRRGRTCELRTTSTRSSTGWRCRTAARFAVPAAGRSTVHGPSWPAKASSRWRSGSRTAPSSTTGRGCRAFTPPGWRDFHRFQTSTTGQTSSRLLLHRILCWSVILTVTGVFRYAVTGAKTGRRGRPAGSRGRSSMRFWRWSL